MDENIIVFFVWINIHKEEINCFNDENKLQITKKCYTLQIKRCKGVLEMADVLKNVFLSLSENQWLNKGAQKFGLKLGAQSVVAGTNIDETIETIKRLNALGIETTVDNLGEFVHDRAEATKAKEQILAVLDAIHEHGVQSHISIKPSQVGLDIDFQFCLNNILEIAEKAHAYNIFINLDQENYARLQQTFHILEAVHEKYPHTVGTVIQAYFYDAMDNLKTYENFRLRIVKGAYKEPPSIAYTDKKEIDDNYIKLLEYSLLHAKYTSVATHDHRVIDHVKHFVKMHNISHDCFEFQMLYGFRTDMQEALAKEGYHFTTYVPFGEDWYGYFMRRLAERPQNLSLVTKQVFTKKTNTILAVAAGALVVSRLLKRS